MKANQKILSRSLPYTLRHLSRSLHSPSCSILSSLQTYRCFTRSFSSLSPLSLSSSSPCRSLSSLSSSHSRRSSVPLRDQELHVLVMDCDGNRTETVLSPKDLKREWDIHYRDITALDVSLSLSLSVQHSKRLKLKHVRRATSLLSPRENCLLVSLGNIKILLMSNKFLVFDYHNPVVKSWLNHLSLSLSSQKELRHLPGPLDPLEGREQGREQEEQPFELLILEELLVNTCSHFDRRLILYNSLLRNIFQEADRADRSHHGIFIFSLLSNVLRPNFESLQDSREDIIYKLSPLMEILHDFELEIKECRECLLELLKNDSDMSRAMLTARSHALQSDLPHDDTKHEDIELMLENYVLRLGNVLNDVSHLEHRISSKQSLSDLTMKIKRNRLLWLNANLAATSVCLGFGAYVFGSFGMNLSSGLEIASSPYLFCAVNGVTLVSVGVIYSRLLHYMHGASPLSTEQRQVANRRLVDSLFLDTVLIDSLLSSAYERLHQNNGKLSREEFSQIFAEIKGVKYVNTKEVDAVFDLIDTDSDGTWSSKEMVKTEPQSTPPSPLVR